MSEPNQPNEYGYAGGASTPEPTEAHPDATTTDEDGESVAVPADDLTGALSDGLDDMAHGGDDTATR